MSASRFAYQQAPNTHKQESLARMLSVRCIRALSLGPHLTAAAEVIN